MEELNNTDVIKTKKQMSYQNGKIYVIRSHQTNNVYIGSTTQPLSKRFALHLRHFKSQHIYLTSFEIIKYGDAYIELLEDCPCDTKEQLLRKEGELIRATENCVNKVISGRTMQEYYIDHKESIIEKNKTYYANNRNAIIEQKKQYYSDNKDEIGEKHKNYYIQNKDKIVAKNSCECGGHYMYSNKSNHLKSIRHNEYINNQKI